MKVTIHCEGTAKEIAAQLNHAAAVYATAPGATTPAATPEKTAKPKKAPKVEEETFDLEQEDAEIEEATEESDDDAPAEIEEEDEAPTDKDVAAALAKHAKLPAGRAGTMKLLSKFGVKSVKELKPKQYAAVIAATKKK